MFSGDGLWIKKGCFGAVSGAAVVVGESCLYSACSRRKKLRGLKGVRLTGRD